jgi:hypothetical protein
MRRWRGLAELVVDAVEHGSAGVEKVHQWTARKPFEIAALVPRIARPARILAEAQGIAIAATYATVRQASRIVGAGVELGLVLAEQRRLVKEAAAARRAVPRDDGSDDPPPDGEVPLGRGPPTPRGRR